jgi:hypothetical protein
MRKISILLSVALVLSACSGVDVTSDDGTGGGSAAPTGMIVDGRITDEALADIVTSPQEVDTERLDALAADLLSRPVEEQQAVLADLALRGELTAGAISGLVKEAGGAEGMTAALQRAFLPVQEMVAAAAQPASSGFRTAAAPTDTGGMATIGLFMGYMALGTTSSVMVSGTDRMEVDEVVSEKFGEGGTIDASLNAVALDLRYSGTEKDGMQVEFHARSEIQVCPAENGLLDIAALIEVTVSKNGKRQKAVVDAKARIQVGDDAEIVSQDGETHVQWAANDGSSEQSIDVTLGTGSKPKYTFNGASLNITEDFARSSIVTGGVIGQMVMMFIVNAAEKGWKSGRCVQLNLSPSAGPSGLEPGDTVTVQAQPRSKIDRSPTGGTVTAILSGGEKSIDPTSTPLQADAEFTYTASDEKDKSGTVDFESKSKRGIGKASITFDTNSVRYSASYSGGGISISGEVANLSQPFDLDATFTGGDAVFSFSPNGEKGGSFAINGGGSGASVTGGGTYTVTDNDDGTKTLLATGNACVDVSSLCSDVVHPITLTPIK